MQVNPLSSSPLKSLQRKDEVLYKLLLLMAELIFVLTLDVVMIYLQPKMAASHVAKCVNKTDYFTPASVTVLNVSSVFKPYKLLVKTVKSPFIEVIELFCYDGFLCNLVKNMIISFNVKSI